MDGERAARDVGHLEHLAVVDARRDEAGRDVNHEAKPRKAAAPFEPPADVARQPDALARDAMNGFPRLQQIRTLEWEDLGNRPVVCRLHQLDDRRAAAHDANLIAEMEVDGS